MTDAIRNRLKVRVVNDDNEWVSLMLTDSSVETVRDEAAGQMVGALAAFWQVEKEILPGHGWADVARDDLSDARETLQLALECVEVLIACRPDPYQ